MPVSLTPAAQDYVAAVFRLSGGGRRATPTAVARYLGVAIASASQMLHGLTDRRVVEWAPAGGGVLLTESGARYATRLIHRHRVIESYLVGVLGIPADRVHAEADRLEHAVSDELVARLFTALGAPAFDPHGATIPELPEGPDSIIESAGRGPAGGVAHRRRRSRGPASREHL